MIIASIILFNPDIQRLRDNIEAVSQQVDCILLIDNSSQNINEIKNISAQSCEIKLIANEENKGIAYALNQALQYSRLLNSTWLLTLDQDSVVPPNMIEEYVKYTEIEGVALITCKIVDRNIGPISSLEDHNTDFTIIDTCITSATYVNVDKINSIGGFDNNFFIDSVDHDICIRARHAGYKILRVNSVALYHEVGHSKIVNFLGKSSIIYNHSSVRHYYIIRNKFFLARKHDCWLESIRKIAKHFLLVVLYEDDKVKKGASMLHGIYDGLFKKNI